MADEITRPDRAQEPAPMAAALPPRPRMTPAPTRRAARRFDRLPRLLLLLATLAVAGANLLSAWALVAQARLEAGLTLDAAALALLEETEAAIRQAEPRAAAPVVTPEALPHLARRLAELPGPGAGLRLLGADGTVLVALPADAQPAGPLSLGRVVARYDAAHMPLSAEVEVTLAAAIGDRWPVLAALGASALLLGLAVPVLGALGRRLARSRAAAAEAAARDAAEIARLHDAAEAAEARHRSDLAVRDAAFHATLDSMSQGLMTFGRHARLTLANGRCAELVGLPLEALRPGITLAALRGAVRLAEAHGAARILDRLLPLVVRGEAGAFVEEVAPQRSVLVVCRPLADGGWLATFEDASGERAAERRIHHLARHDALTGLPNRLALDEHLARMLRDAAAAGGAAAVLHLNLGRLRGVNEALGARTGDALIRAAAGRLLREVRRDRGGIMLARLGADEFALVTPLTRDLRDGAGPEAAQLAAQSVVQLAARLAERLVAAIARPFDVEGFRVVVAAAVGIATIPAAATAEDALAQAGLAMRAAQGSAGGGARGGTAVFAPEMAARAQMDRLLELDLRLALTTGAGQDFEVRYQPVADLPACRIGGVEASLWWRHAVHGLVAAEVLAPLAAALGLEEALGRLLLRRACAEAACGARDLRLAVGLTAAQFLDPGLVERVAATLAETGLPAQRLELLVREADLAAMPGLLVGTLHRLRGRGVRIVLDGLGGSALAPAAVRALPFDRARLSPLLVAELGGRNHGIELARAVIGLCSRHGIPVGAAGVETEEQCRLLEAERCGQAQGGIIGPPMPMAELAQLLWRAPALEVPVAPADWAEPAHAG